MKPKTAGYLAAAAKALVAARGNLTLNFAEQAARLAYYAQFHAAQALIFERTEQIAKTHKGVARLFHKLAKSETGLEARFPGDLTNFYQFKQIADYETGGDELVSLSDAAQAIVLADQFVAAVQSILDPA